MRSAALVLAVLVALGAGVSPLVAQTKAPAPAPRTGSGPPAAAPKPAAKAGDKSVGPRSNAPIVIDADRMEAFKKDGLVVFTGNVIAKQENSVRPERMEVYRRQGRWVLASFDRERQDRHGRLPHGTGGDRRTARRYRDECWVRR